ncbi:MAG TPA: hypothetical protein VJ208_00165 [Candidatus Nanoarchaeia archaeon]|nr:hypothetical protein [Candidatus Nanoarchaeia archaeon]
MTKQYEGPMAEKIGNCIWKTFSETSFGKDNTEVNFYQLCARCDGTKESAEKLKCDAYKEWPK